MKADEMDDGYNVGTEMGWIHQYTPAVVLWW